MTKQITSTPSATFATWILSQCGDKQAQAIVRIETVRAQIIVALKGNKTQWMQGAEAVAKAKRTIEKAFRAGFMAVGDISAMYKPQDQSLTKEQKAEAIESRADELVMVFESAYLAEIPADKTQAEKDKAKADKVAAKDKEIAEAVEKEISARGLKPATEGEILTAALSMIQSGKVGTTLLDEFLTALGVPAMLDQRYMDGKSAALAEIADKSTRTEKGRTKDKAAVPA